MRFWIGFLLAVIIFLLFFLLERPDYNVGALRLHYIIAMVLVSIAIGVGSALEGRYFERKQKDKEKTDT